MTETMPTETEISFWVPWPLALCLERRSQREFIGSTEHPHRLGREREHMDHQQPTTACTFGAGSEHTS